MSPRQKKPDTQRILATLKDFQRQTVDYVFRRLYTDPDAVKRFLIADEVGLGKTLVARGVIARAIEHIWDSIDRIDIVYICANRDIARQNVNRLNVTGRREVALATRMTLLPLHLHNIKDEKLNFVSFTPGTSFDLRSKGGMWYERALIYHILRDGWKLGESAGPKNVLQCGVGKDRWRRLLREFPVDEIDQEMAGTYIKALKGEGVRRRFNAITKRFAWHRKHIPAEDAALRANLVGELRSILARSCVDALEPDVVILDEFQRFKNLLDGDDEVAQLAKAVFDFPDAKVILLSATPYKMYTMHHEQQTEDHYTDFLRTARFLFGSDDETAAFEKDLARFRRVLLDLSPSDGDDLLRTKRVIEGKLRRVMSRTERLPATTDRSGMIAEARHGRATLQPDDLDAFAAIDNVAGCLGVGDMVEYWKSAPYLLNVMDRDGYKVKKTLVSHTEEPGNPELAQALHAAKKSLLSWQTVRSYRPMEPGNAKLRSLLEHKVDPGAWRLLWVPPSLPYYRPGEGPYADDGLQSFSKSLVFSSWLVVPKVIAMLTSYEAERRMVTPFDPTADYSTERRRRRPLLQFTFSKGRPTGMSTFPLIYPCLTLATRIDPLMVSAELARNGSVPDVQRVHNEIARRLGELLRPILRQYPGKGGQVDERWYWVALALLDRKYFGRAVRKWLQTDDQKLAWASMVRRTDKSEGDFAEHVRIFERLLRRKRRLRRPPDDLIPVLTKVAMASPAVVALRSLLRTCDGVEPDKLAPQLLPAAARVAMGFRSLFNLPESMTLIRTMKSGDDTRYWESVLDYCVDGNLQAVMDEYAHILRESLGLIDSPADVTVPQVAEEIHTAVSIRTVNLDFDAIRANPSSGTVELDRHSIRCRYALRFGDARSEEEGAETRADQVRCAFNSPFRPFILATTSIGQEGLDFHQYCHEIYHWNLPANPVDLEQREGRIHRYKGHVIRCNAARAYPLPSLCSRVAPLADPWKTVFELAGRERDSGQNDLVPFWIFELEGGHKVYRHVPALPLSRECQHLTDLQNTLVAYRMVLGQPRQEDLVNFLQERLHDDLSPDDLIKYRIDLAPPIARTAEFIESPRR